MWLIIQNNLNLNCDFDNLKIEKNISWTGVLRSGSQLSLRRNNPKFLAYPNSWHPLPYTSFTTCYCNVAADVSLIYEARPLQAD